MSQALSTGETVRAEEVVFQVPDGRSVTVLINATPIRSDKGEVETFVVTMQDMTPLEEIERLRAGFLAMVSHELRTPLATVRGSVSALLDEFSGMHPAEVRQFHRIIFEQTDRMRALIADLLDVARIATGALSVSPGPTDVAVLTAEAGNAFRIGGHEARPSHRRPAGPALGHGGQIAHRPGAWQPAGQRGQALTGDVHHKGERRARRPPSLGVGLR